jgi:hypothetical protein
MDGVSYTPNNAGGMPPIQLVNKVDMSGHCSLGNLRMVARRGGKARY